MKLTQNSIRNTKKLLSDIQENQEFAIGLEITKEIEEIIKSKLDITISEVDKSFMPSPLIGKNTMRNADGEYLPDKSKEKEIAYRPHEYSLEGWDGKTHSGICYVPYERYPKKFIQPYGLEMIISNQNNTKYIYIFNVFKKSVSSDEKIKFAANLMLEVFHTVDTLTLNEDNQFIKNTPIEKVNWLIFPPGSKISEEIQKNIKQSISKTEIKFIQKRIEWLQSKSPTSIKEGLGGYTGYLVFEFKKPKHNIYVIDSMIYGKATYIFEDNWENVSRLTKKEIIQNNLAKDRIIHNNSWEKNVSNYID